MSADLSREDARAIARIIFAARQRRTREAAERERREQESRASAARLTTNDVAHAPTKTKGGPDRGTA